MAVTDCWVSQGWVEESPEWVEGVCEPASISHGDSGVGQRVNWQAQSALIWEAEQKRRKDLGIPTIEELEASIARRVALLRHGKQVEDEWLLGLIDDATYMKEAA